jgi:pyrroline-5-carboxylate reductase
MKKTVATAQKARKYRLAILGGGNIGSSLAKGLQKAGVYDAGNLIITDNRESRINWLTGNGFRATTNNSEAVSLSEIIVLAVKPQQFAGLASEIKGNLSSDHVLISTITGVSFADIEAALGKRPVIRIMPNTAMELCESMTCISFYNTKSAEEKLVTSIFDKLGKTAIIPEELMSAATVIGACGTAFALRFMRAMSQGGIEIGFNSEMSQLITAQTVKGAARLILESASHPEKEIDKVTTPQGITISGLNEMEHQGLSSAVIRGLTTSFSKLENLHGKIKK